MGAECVVDGPAMPLVRGQLAELLDVGAWDQDRDGVFGGVGDAAEVGSRDQVEHGLFDGGDPALAEIGPMALHVEPGDVAADEVDRGRSVGQLQRAAMPADGDDGHVERAGDGTVYAGGADPHQGAVVDVPPALGDAQRGGL